MFYLRIFLCFAKKINFLWKAFKFKIWLSKNLTWYHFQIKSRRPLVSVPSLTWITIWSLRRVISPLSPSETWRLCVTCRGFSPAASLAQYFDGKYPSLPRHFPFHQSGSDLSMTVTLIFSVGWVSIQVAHKLHHLLYSQLWDRARLDVLIWNCKEQRTSSLAVIVVASVSRQQKRQWSVISRSIFIGRSNQF